MIKDLNEFLSITGPIKRGIEDLINKSKNPQIVQRAKNMKADLNAIMKQKPY